jgi:hypothetical protein
MKVLWIGVGAWHAMPCPYNSIEAKSFNNIEMKSHTFKAKIYSVGINRCVDVPAKIRKALGDDKHIPVAGTIDDLPFESTLTPRGDGLYRLFVHSSIWRKLGVDNGDSVTVKLRSGQAPDDLPVPDDVLESLLRNEDAKAIFDNLTTRSRNSYIAFINQAKNPETRKKRLEVGIERLLERGEKKKRK